jgi:biopolymer transport protein ExbD
VPVENLKEDAVRISSRLLSFVTLLVVVVGANAQAPVASPEEFTLRVDSEGLFSATVGGAQLPLDEAAVRERASAALRAGGGVIFAVEADAAAPLARVTRAAQLLQQAGATRIDFHTIGAQL